MVFHKAKHLPSKRQKADGWLPVYGIYEIIDNKRRLQYDKKKTKVRGSVKIIPKNKDELWQEAKKRCKLNEEDLRLAMELGLNPRSLISNIPNKSDPWKVSVKI